MSAIDGENLRLGDRVLVAADIAGGTRSDPEKRVVFKNGDSLPLRCVVVSEIAETAFAAGDRVQFQDGSNRAEGVVRGVYGTGAERQLWILPDGKWPLVTKMAAHVTRIGG